ncbi:hypothetical protein JB92DRAFT_3112705 [Gautieria morchelliformis]|nr:hypothetical protein JB92DRAFT_3112705 [Gautieria morchelliformis]
MPAPPHTDHLNRPSSLDGAQAPYAAARLMVHKNRTSPLASRCTGTVRRLPVRCTRTVRRRSPQGAPEPSVASPLTVHMHRRTQRPLTVHRRRPSPLGSRCTCTDRRPRRAADSRFRFDSGGPSSRRASPPARSSSAHASAPHARGCCHNRQSRATHAAPTHLATLPSVLHPLSPSPSPRAPPPPPSLRVDQGRPLILPPPVREATPRIFTPTALPSPP